MVLSRAIFHQVQMALPTGVSLEPPLAGPAAVGAAVMVMATLSPAPAPSPPYISSPMAHLDSYYRSLRTTTPIEEFVVGGISELLIQE